MKDNIPQPPATATTAPDPAQAERIARLRERIRNLPGGALIGCSDSCPADVEERFLANVLSIEEEPTVSLLEQLQTRGVRVVPPETLDDADLTPALWQLIEALADVGICLERTDHLSDRQLYDWLWTTQLPEPINLPECDDGGTWHFDVLGGCSLEDLRTCLTYYADDYYREQWVEEFPNEPLPEPRPRPFDRDRHLP